MSSKDIPVVASSYPCGPCDYPKRCPCGFVFLTEDNVKHEECEGECDICEYCGDDKCPICGEHTHCGGCI